MKTILFPTDFTPLASQAFQYAIHLADKLDAWIILLHAHHYTRADSEFIPDGIMNALTSEEEQKVLEQFSDYESEVQKMLGKRVKIVPRVVFGFPKDQILEVSNKMKPDLIVMGTQGNRPWLNRILGSVTSEVINHAPCPVLAVPEDASYQGIERIIYATNFEEDTLEVFDQLAQFAGILEAKLACVHIKTENNGWDIVQLNLFNRLYQERIHSHQAEFFLQNDPDVVHGLNSFMETHPGEILAMRLQSRDLLEKLFRPNITQQMAKQSNVPLLTFRSEAVVHLCN